LSATPSASSPVAAGAAPAPQVTLALIGVGAAVALALHVASRSPRLSILFLIGLLCGATLYHAAFGFTRAYRRLLFERETSGVKAQVVMLALASVLFAPILAAGSFLGQPVAGAGAPAGWQVAIGAFLFGAGMQLAGGCGSGTLYTVGGGSARMVIALAAFCAGGFWASLHMEAWQRLPDLGTVVLGDALGWPGAVALQLGVLALVYALLRRWERPAGPATPVAPWRWTRILTGPWPLLAGAVLLALLNLATLAVAGHPWSITWAFTLWGAKVATAVGWDPSVSAFWDSEFQRSALEASVLEDVTSVMDAGIVVGAFVAAALAGRFSPTLRMRPGALVSAILGGLLMGYGARIAFGCNIGAFFSGVASTSLHGWIWIAAALPGTWIGARLRARFGMPI
jgi:uncharacterized membrane protein YedE/YeeE